MAREVRVQLIDDLSGEDADGTVRFSVDGADYEIDLTADHANELRGTLEKYVAHARRLRGTPDRRGARTVSTGREETQKIRDWARAHGYSPSARGRISQDIKKAYDAAQA
jgi:hypothetical protein